VVVIGDPAVFAREGTTSIMTATLRIAAGASLSIRNETLKLNCSRMIEFGIVNEGSLEIEKSHMTSVKKDARAWIRNEAGQGEGYVFLATDSEFSRLGYIDNTPENSIPVSGRRGMGTFTYPVTCNGKTARPLLFCRNVIHDCDLAMWISNAAKARVVGNTFRDIRGFINGDYYPPGQKRLSMGNNFGIVDFRAGNDLLFACNRIHDVRRDDQEPTGHIIRAFGDQGNLVIEANEIYNCDGDEAILLKHSPGVVVRDNYIHDVTFKFSTAGWGLVIYLGMNERAGACLANNRIENCRGGISAMYDAREGNTIAGNWIHGCYVGISLMGTADNTVADNTVNGSLWGNLKIADTSYRGRQLATRNLVLKNNVICGEEAKPIETGKLDVKPLGNITLGNDMKAMPGPPAFKIFLIPKTAEIGQTVTFMVIPLERLAGEPTASVEIPGSKKDIKLERFRGPEKTIVGDEPKNRYLFTYKGQFDTRGMQGGKGKVTVLGTDAEGLSGSTSAEFTIVEAMR
jgi:parallel beta-helix repeat protein